MIEEPYATRVRELIRLLERIPENRFDMETYCAVNGFHQHNIIPANVCGTTACIAGWATTIIPETLLIRDKYNKIDYELSVCTWLCLNEKQADLLFHNYGACKADAICVLETYLHTAHIIWPEKSCQTLPRSAMSIST